MDEGTMSHAGLQILSFVLLMGLVAYVAFGVGV